MRAFAFIACLGIASVASAQVSSWDDMVSTARAAWKTVGRPMAERIAREAPERFQKAKKQAMSLIKQAEIYADSGDLGRKKEIVAELWRIRGSLDLMALLDPSTLKMFGIDVPDLAKLRREVVRHINALRN